MKISSNHPFVVALEDSLIEKLGGIVPPNFTAIFEEQYNCKVTYPPNDPYVLIADVTFYEGPQLTLLRLKYGDRY